MKITIAKTQTSTYKITFNDRTYYIGLRSIQVILSERQEKRFWQHWRHSKHPITFQVDDDNKDLYAITTPEYQNYYREQEDNFKQLLEMGKQ